MKALLLVGFFVFAAPFSYAQPNNVITAYMNLQENKLSEAKTNIEAAITHEKTAESAKTWFYAGKIYMAIYHECSKNNSDFEGYPADYYLGQAKNAFYIATTFDMSRINENELMRAYQLTADYMLNEGVSLYNNEAYKRAALMFEGTILVNKDFNITDSLAHFNAALAHEKANNIQKAIEFYSKCAIMDYGGALAYNSAIALLLQTGQTEIAMELVLTARRKYPNDPSLLVTEINMLLKEEKYTEALFAVDQALVQMPNNANLLFTRGTLLEPTNLEEAIASYERAIIADPNHTMAFYNLGAAYYNIAVDLRNAENATIDAGKEELELARGYLQQVELLSPGNTEVQKSLSIIKEILESE